MKTEQRSGFVLFQRLMVIGLIGWHGLTYIRNYRSLVTTVTYIPPPQAWVWLLLLMLLWCSSSIVCRYWCPGAGLELRTVSSLNSCYRDLSWNLNKAQYVSLLLSRDLAGGSVRPQRGSEMCVGVFRPSIFISSSFVSNVPLTFLAGMRGERMGRETRSLKWSVRQWGGRRGGGGRGRVVKWGECCSCGGGGGGIMVHCVSHC